jgi:hypothetical protein
MIRVVKYTLWTIWILFAVGFGTTVGATHGWAHHGWIGAIALGFVGFCFGGLAACSAELGLEFLAAIVFALL